MGMVKTLRRKGRRRYIETYEFPKALQIKLQEELGDTRTADIALEGLRGWYLAYLYADGALIGMPSKAVDEAWHEMILMTREYTWFCQQAFGHYLHHSPESTLDVSMDALLAETIGLGRRARPADGPLHRRHRRPPRGRHALGAQRPQPAARSWPRRAEDRRRRERRCRLRLEQQRRGGGWLLRHRRRRRRPSDGGGSSCGGGGCGGGGCGGGG